MICELCGKETDKLYRVIIEGVEMLVCEQCAKFGKVLGPYQEKREERVEEEIAIEEEILEDNWKDEVKKEIRKRLKGGKTIEELSRELNLKESLLRKLLSGEVEIDLNLAKRLEKIFGIKLIMKQRVVSTKSRKKKEEEPIITLGDIVKIRVRS